MAAEISAVSEKSADPGPVVLARLACSRRLRRTARLVEIPVLVVPHKGVAVKAPIAVLRHPAVAAEAPTAALRHPAVAHLAAAVVLEAARPAAVVVVRLMAAAPMAEDTADKPKPRR
jgi:hypothetical protein